jgi:hypothetical protein
MKCPTCGEDVVDLARCENCGTPMPGEEKTQVPSEDQKPQAAFAKPGETETRDGEPPRQNEVYSFDQDLEFADADALLEDKPIETVNGGPAAADWSNQNPSGQAGTTEPTPEEYIHETTAQAPPGTGVIQPSDYSDGKPQPIPAMPHSPQPSQPAAVQNAGTRPNAVYPPMPDFQARKIGIKQPEGLSVSQFRNPPQDIVPPVPAGYNQTPQAIPRAPLPTREGPASIIHQNKGFNSFVQPEIPQQNVPSPFMDTPGSNTGEVTSYDFQPSIYYKQALGDSQTDEVFHREDVYAQKIENQPNVEKDDGFIPPSFARSLDNSGFTGLRTGSPAKPSSAQIAYQSANPRRDDYRDKNRTKIISVIFQIAFILLAVSSFFLMDVFATINSGLNPYDQLKTMRYLVFILITIASVSSLFIKNLAGRLPILIPLMLVITGLFLYGTASLKIVIKPDKTSNFFIIKTGNPITIVEDDSFDATEPVVSSGGTKALYSKRVYEAESTAHRIGLIEFGTQNKGITSNLKDTQLAVNGNFQWFDDDSIIFSDLKIELPTEMNNPVLMASKNELYFDFTSTFNIFNLQNGIAAQHYQFTSKLPFSLYLKQIVNKSENTILMQLSRIYTSPDKAEYHFTFNQKTGLIAACYMGGIWLIDPATGISKKITRGGDIGYPYLDTWPEFNSEGNKIFFVRTRIGEKIDNDILQLGATAALNVDEPLLPASVTNDIYNYLNFSVSPGGRFLAAWMFAYQDTGATRDEAALVLFDMKLNKHIKIYPLEPDYRTTDQFVSNIDWSRKGNFILIQINRLLHSSIKRIDIPEEISAIDKK